MTALAFFSGQSLLHALGWSLLHFCWQGMIVAVLLACVLGLLRGRSPQSRYVAACLALALMIVLPLATFVRLATVAPVVQSAITNPALARDSAQSLQSGFGEVAAPWLDQVVSTLDHAMSWLLAGWVTGVILLLCRLNIGLIVARKMRSVTAEAVPIELQRQFHELTYRLGITRPVSLIGSALIQVPTVIGWFRPVILMPMGCLLGLSTIQVEAVLAHELAHIKRHDYLVSVFQAFIEAMLFYHPAVWWISSQLRKEREHCCDDLAVKISGDSLAYAKALSFLEEHRSFSPVVALGANGGVLAMRIRRLLGCKETPVVSRMAAAMLLTIVITAAGLCIGTVVLAHADTGKKVASQEKGSQSLPAMYQQWVDEDVLWIITPEERSAYLKLTENSERDAFIKQFWERRNPTPSAAENTFKQEHYRRIAYANKHFTADVPGWRTDRGRIFIIYGQPVSIDVHPLGDEHSAKAYETWHYRSKDMKFVDDCNCGDYRLQTLAKK